MLSRALLLGSVMALGLAATASAQVERREVGQLVFEGAPPLPDAVAEAIAPYYEVRSAVFEDWMADGSMLIATRFGQTEQIHHVAAPMAARTQLTFFDEPITVATAQPGASRFAYRRDEGGSEYYQGFLRDLQGHEVRLTKPDTRNSDFVFSKDGARVAWSQVTPGDPNYDIMLADAASPEGRRVVLEGEGAMSPLEISADGARMLLTRYNSIADVELFVLDVASGELTRLGPKDRKVHYAGAAFGPGGNTVVTLSDDGSEVTRPVVFDLATGAMRELERGAKWGAEGFDLTPDGRTIAYVVNEEGYSKVVLRDVATGREIAGPDLPKGVLTALKFSPDRARLGLSLSTYNSSGDVWSYDLASRKLTRWTDSELGGLDPATLVEPSLFRYTTFDGRSIPAFVYKPQGASGKLPVVIQIHGGPEGQELPSFSARRQAWVNELGAAVIIPNVRGSSGYGKTYLSLDNAEKREDSVKDIGALLDWVAQQPDLDSSRVAVVGQSYGGYMALAVAAHYNPRLVGVIDLYGISDFATFLENTEGYRRDLRRAEYGDERDPAMRAVFEKIAPINMSDRMQKPMMIYQGANDPRVPQSESEQMVAKLRQQGTEVWYVLAKDEGHGVHKKANQEQVRATEVQFLKKVLGLEP